MLATSQNPLDWRGDPAFHNFIVAMKGMIPKSYAKPTLLDRSTRSYDDPARHPMVRLAFYAKKRCKPEEFRGCIVACLLRGARTNEAMPKIDKVMAVYDAAASPEPNPIAIREAVKNASHTRRGWAEQV